MYTENPEEYLTHRGSMLKPIEEKHSDVSITTRQHDLKIQDLKIEAELEEKQWKSVVLNYIEKVVYSLERWPYLLVLLLFVLIS